MALAALILSSTFLTCTGALLAVMLLTGKSLVTVTVNVQPAQPANVILHQSMFGDLSTRPSR